MLVFLFNLFGYRVLIDFLQTRSEQKLESLIDNSEYREEELIEFRVPIHMPYQQRNTAFERYYGHISIGGQEYTYVKRKIEGDVLILKCLPNHSKTILKNLAADMTQANSNSSPGNMPLKSTAKIFCFDCEEAFHYQFSMMINAVSSRYYQYTDALNDAPAWVPYQPPRC